MKIHRCLGEDNSGLWRGTEWPHSSLLAGRWPIPSKRSAKNLHCLFRTPSLFMTLDAKHQHLQPTTLTPNDEMYIAPIFHNCVSITHRNIRGGHYAVTHISICAPFSFMNSYVRIGHVRPLLCRTTFFYQGLHLLKDQDFKPVCQIPEWLKQWGSTTKWMWDTYLQHPLLSLLAIYGERRDRLSEVWINYFMGFSKTHPNL